MPARALWPQAATSQALMSLLTQTRVGDAEDAGPVFPEALEIDIIDDRREFIHGTLGVESRAQTGMKILLGRRSRDGENSK